MSRIYLLIISLCFLSQKSFSQTKITLDIGPILSAEWNLYHWYQHTSNHPFSIASGGNRSVGQVLNVLPSARLGIIFTFDIRTIKRGIA
jgi:hypothetical protein